MSFQCELLHTGWSVLGVVQKRPQSDSGNLLQGEWCTEVASRADAKFCNSTFWRAGVILCPASHGSHCHRVNNFFI